MSSSSHPAGSRTYIESHLGVGETRVIFRFFCILGIKKRRARGPAENNFIWSLKIEIKSKGMLFDFFLTLIQSQFGFQYSSKINHC